MIEKIVLVKTMSGKIKPTILKGVYCKHYRFDKDCFFSGCCFDKKNRYSKCEYYDKPWECSNYIPNGDVMS